MESLNLWWDGQEPSLKVFYVLAALSTTVFVVNFVMSLFGHDSDSDAGVDADADMHSDFHADGGHGGGLSHIFSFKAIIAFLMGASWCGVSALRSGWALPIVIIASLVAGGLVMVATAYMLSLFLRLQQDNTLTMDKTVGCTGEVYLTVPAGMATGGQVEILVNNSYKTFEAVTDDAQPLRPHCKILVLDVLEDNVLLVARMPESLDGGMEPPKLDNI